MLTNIASSATYVGGGTNKRQKRDARAHTHTHSLREDGSTNETSTKKLETDQAPAGRDAHAHPPPHHITLQRDTSPHRRCVRARAHRRS